MQANLPGTRPAPGTTLEVPVVTQSGVLRPEHEVAGVGQQKKVCVIQKEKREAKRGSANCVQVIRDGMPTSWKRQRWSDALH